MHFVDSRGFTDDDSYSLDHSVEAYINPVIQNFTVDRCNPDGTIDDEGVCLKINATGTTQQPNGIQGQIASATNKWSISVVEKGLLGLGGAHDIYSNSLTNVIIGDADHPIVAPEKTYVITATLTDRFGAVTNPLRTEIGVATYTIHRMAGGQGVAFGKSSEKFGVEVRETWPFYTHGKEIQKLILDAAHPIGSMLTTYNDAFDPNAEWPWTHWAMLDQQTIQSLNVNLWVRTT